MKMFQFFLLFAIYSPSHDTSLFLSSDGTAFLWCSAIITCLNSYRYNLKKLTAY